MPEINSILEDEYLTRYEKLIELLNTSRIIEDLMYLSLSEYLNNGNYTYKGVIDHNAINGLSNVWGKIPTTFDNLVCILSSSTPSNTPDYNYYIAYRQAVVVDNDGVITVSDITVNAEGSSAYENSLRIIPNTSSTFSGNYMKGIAERIRIIPFLKVK